MAKEKAATPSLFSELFLHTGLYKRSQGKITRQVTFATIAITTGLAAYEMWNYLVTYDLGLLRFALPAALLAVGVWIGFRLVNMPRFADFLIAVEAEMNKVSWPSRTELIRSSIVVIAVIFLLAGVLWMYDVIWRLLFEWLGVIHGAS